MSRPQLKFWWEWKAASPFWPGDDAAKEMFGYGEIDPAKLALPGDLVAELEALAAWHDSSLNWDYPPDPGPWRQEECDRFNVASKTLFERCKKLLAGRFEILYSHREEKEDPDLDAYLAAPTSFRRKA
jgi:hypothetical protein